MNISYLSINYLIKLIKNYKISKIKINIILTFLFKILALSISFILVPITINYLNVELYGIWLVIISIMSWVTFFDIGLGNGLRNKLAESIAKGDKNLAKRYVSTAYATISVIVFFILINFLLVLPFINLNKIFNTHSISNIELMKVFSVVVFFFLLNFILSLSNQVFYAYQESALISIGQFFFNLFTLLTVCVLTYLEHGNLFYLGISYGFSMLISNLLVNCYFFKKHKDIFPSIKYIDPNKINDLLTLGIKFFVIQIAVLVIFTTDNIIISYILGPEHVTSYNVVFRLFSIVSIIHGIILTPFWSAFTDAYVKGNILWIKRTLIKLNLLIIPLSIMVVILIFFNRDLINIWIGHEIIYSDSLVLLMGIYTIINIWNNTYSYFLNGAGKIEIQLFISIIGALINIPLSIYFAKFLNMGTSGIILGTICSLSIFAIIGPVQTFNIIKNFREELNAKIS